MTMEEYEEINLDELKDGGATRDPSVPKETRKRTDGKKKRRAHKNKKRKRKPYMQITLYIQLNGDEDILDYLDKMKSEHGYTPTQIFKDLIRKEIEQWYNYYYSLPYRYGCRYWHYTFLHGTLLTRSISSLSKSTEKILSGIVCSNVINDLSPARRRVF